MILLALGSFQRRLFWASQCLKCHVLAFQSTGRGDNPGDPNSRSNRFTWWWSRGPAPPKNGPRALGPISPISPISPTPSDSRPSRRYADKRPPGLLLGGDGSFRLSDLMREWGREKAGPDQHVSLTRGPRGPWGPWSPRGPRGPSRTLR